MKKIIVLLFCLFSLLISNFNDIKGEEYYKETQIENIDTTIKVNKDYTFNVEQKIDAYLDYKHGIFVNIPYEVGVNDISDIKVSGPGTCDISKEIKHKVGVITLKIGDPDDYFDGQESWKVSYKIRGYKNNHNKANKLSLSLVGAYWKLPIAHTKTTIIMPEKTNWQGLEMASGPDSIDLKSDKHFTYQTNNNELIVEGNNLPEEYGASMGLKLPANYWHHYSRYPAAINKLLSMYGIALVVALVLWFIFGRDKKPTPTVEFYPPYHMTPAELGYFVDGKCDSKDITAMYFYFAQKGCVTISKNKDGDFIITKVSDLPADAISYEKTLFNGMFADGDQLDVNNIDNSFIDSVETTKDQLRRYFYNNNFYLYDKVASFVKNFEIIAFLLMILFIGIPMIPTLKLLDILIYMGLIIGTYFASEKLLIRSEKLTDDNNGHGSLLLYGMGSIAIIALTAYDMNLCYSCPITGFIIGIFIVLTITAIRFTTRRNPKLLEIQGKVLGFKEFIKRAKLDQLNMLVEENPSYFYDILPYAYVLGLTDKWAKHFESIELKMPVWLNNIDIIDLIYIGDIFDDITTSFDSRVSAESAKNISDSVNDIFDSSSSGFSSSGGSSSSGGFGGGGGGAW